MAIIKVEDIAHVRFAAPDLALMRGFLEDFGLACFEEGGKLYGKGSDGRPFVHATEQGEAKFLAVGLRAASIADLEALVAHEGVGLEPLNETGGGMVVRLTDPDGYRVEVVAGPLDVHSHRQPVANGAQGPFPGMRQVELPLGSRFDEPRQI